MLRRSIPPSPVAPRSGADVVAATAASLAPPAVAALAAPELLIIIPLR
jgi:hypothetical protein